MSDSFPQILCRLRKERRLNQRTAAAELNISPTTIVVAKKVLAEDFEAIIREYVTTKSAEGVYHREGQTVTVSAWLKEN